MKQFLNRMFRLVNKTMFLRDQLEYLNNFWPEIMLKILPWNTEVLLLWYTASFHQLKLTRQTLMDAASQISGVWYYIRIIDWNWLNENFPLWWAGQIGFPDQTHSFIFLYQLALTITRKLSNSLIDLSMLVHKLVRNYEKRYAILWKEEEL